MKTFQIFTLLAVIFLWQACNSGTSKKSDADLANADAKTPKKEYSGKGFGEIRNVELTDPLDQAMIKKGKAIYDMKCAACHKLDDKRVVGPGFQGVTNRRKPEWIMNMITNVDVMLDKDPVAQELLEQCLTRMPNQNVSVGDARDILEFFRKNDMDTVGKKDEATKS
ncbi:MAG: c-type cytochrome [Saprospiraceae bacterium]|nr:c-type cytochrome [Saprospiraceae bacterium]